MTAASPDRPAPEQEAPMPVYPNVYDELDNETLISDAKDVAQILHEATFYTEAQVMLAMSRRIASVAAPSQPPAQEHVATVCAIGSWTEIEPRNAYRPKIGDKLYAAPVAQPPAEWVAEAMRLAVAYAEAANYAQDDPDVDECRVEHGKAFAALRAHLTAGGGR